MAKLERKYQPTVIKRLKAMFPGAFVLKTDPTQIQGIPDLVILYFGKWAVLETKRTNKASYRPNQPFYIHLLNKMGFASVIHPENENEVFSKLREYLTAGGVTNDMARPFKT